MIIPLISSLIDFSKPMCRVHIGTILRTYDVMMTKKGFEILCDAFTSGATDQIMIDGDNWDLNSIQEFYLIESI